MTTGFHAIGSGRNTGRGPNSQHNPTTRLPCYRGRHAVQRNRENHGPRVRAHAVLRRELPAEAPVQAPVVEAPAEEPYVVRSKICMSHLFGVCEEEDGICEFAHSLATQTPLYFDDPEETFGFVYKMQLCTKSTLLTKCIDGINCPARHEDEISGSVCQRFRYVGSCLVADDLCPFVHPREQMESSNDIIMEILLCFAFNDNIQVSMRVEKME